MHTRLLPQLIQFSAVLLAWATVSLSAQSGSRPNIIVIMCDDAGFADFGFTGGVGITPNLDRLANEGMIFTRAYNNGRCWPTRQSFMTGLNPQLTDDGGPDVGADCVTLPEVLGTVGYANYMVGKWHLGNGKDTNPKDTPLGRGFDEFHGALAGANMPTKEKLIQHAEDFIAKGRTPMMIYEGDRMMEYEEIPEDFYETFSWSDRGVKMIKQTPENQPFFLFMSYTAPHWPIAPLPEYVAKYSGMFDGDWEILRRQILDRQIEMGLFEEGYPLAPFPPTITPITEDSQRDRNIQNTEKYYATLTELDDGIQRLIDALKETGRDRNTLVIFLSDNGGEPLIGGPHRALLSNTPFVGGKVSQFEGGMITPFIAWWPGVVPAGTKNLEHEIRLEDFMATVVDLSGATYPSEFQGRPIFPQQGRSFLPAITNPNHDGGPRIWAWDHDGSLAIWMQPWKAIHTELRHPIHKKFTDPALGGWALFKLDEHRVEMDNVADEHPEILMKLVETWGQWAESVGWNPSPRWGMPDFPSGFTIEGAGRNALDPTSYDPSTSPIGKDPRAWLSRN